MPSETAPASLLSWRRARHWLERPRPVRTLLLWMALALVVPAMAFTSYLVARSTALERAQVEQRLVQVAADLANDLDREFERLFALLDSLALSRPLDERDFAAFHAQAKAAVRRLGANIILIDPAMRQLLNTRVPYGAHLPMYSDPDSARKVVATKAPGVSNLFVGAISRKQVFDALKPLSGEGLNDHVLILTVDAEHVYRMLLDQKLPSAWVTGVSDRQGRIVSRSRSHDAYVGKPLPPELLEASRRETGAFSTVNVEGVRTMRAVARSKQSGWLLSANLPLALVDAEIRRAQLTLGLGGLGLLALALALASLFARWIIVPMQALVASAVTFEGSDVPPPLASPVVEANEVAAALRAASIELKSKTDSLRQNERRLDLAQKTARLASIDLEIANQTVSVSDTFENIFGFLPPTDNVAKANQAFLDRVHPDDRERVRAARKLALGKLGSFEEEFRIVLPDGKIRWISAHGETLGDAAGRPIRMIGTNLDITRRKEQEEHIRFLLREVSHRSKNMLAIIQAMAAQTARTSPDYEAFQVRYSQRLQGMAASQDLLVNQNWHGVDVSELVRAQLRPFAEEPGGRLVLSGPALLLKPEAAQSLGLALHELATNATKYGALSAAGGNVRISWEIEGLPPDARFRMTWRETGGPVVAAPARKGFGHTVFERMIGQALNASIDLAYPPEGIVWTLATSLEAVRGE